SRPRSPEPPLSPGILDASTPCRGYQRPRSRETARSVRLVHSPNGVLTPRWPAVGHHGRVGDASSRGLVLVVEDERPIADLVRMYLTREGFGVHVEYDGSAGLAAARKLRPVACVLDIGLPGLTGTEICQQLRGGGDR